MLVAAASLVLAVRPAALEYGILDSLEVDMGYGAAFEVLCVEAGPAGRVVAGGVTAEGVDYMSRAFTVGLGPGWNVEWSGATEGVNSGWITSVSPTWDGGCLCAGATDYSPGDEGDVWVVALDPGGFARWRYHRDGGSELGEAVWVSGSHLGSTAAGYSHDQAGRPRSWLIGLDDDGELTSRASVDLDGFEVMDACSTFAGGTVLVGARYGNAAALMVDATGEPSWTDPAVVEGALTAVEECEGGVLSGGYAYSPDGDPLLCLHSGLGGSRWVRNLAEDGYSGSVLDLAVVPGAGSVLVITDSPVLVVCDRQGKPVGEVDPGFRPAAVAAMEDGTLVVAGSGRGVVRLARLRIEMGTGNGDGSISTRGREATASAACRPASVFPRPR